MPFPLSSLAPMIVALLIFLGFAAIAMCERYIPRVPSSHKREGPAITAPPATAPPAELPTIQKLLPAHTERCALERNYKSLISTPGVWCIVLSLTAVLLLAVVFSISPSRVLEVLAYLFAALPA